MYSSKIITAKGHEGMTLLASSIDDGTESIPDIGFDFFYNEQNCRNTLKISGNSWVGFTGSNEELKVNRRDAKADKIYYAKETISGKPTFRIRWEGFNSWSYKGSYNIAWEVILYNDSAFVLIVEKTTKDGADSFENPSKGRIDLDFKAGTSYAFIPSEDGGKSYLAQEGSYIQAKIKYLIVDGNDIKRWNDNLKQYVKVSELPLIKEKFINYGDDVLHKERVGIVNTKPVLKIWSDAEKMAAPTIVQTLVPKPTIIEMKEDILFNEHYIIAINKAVAEKIQAGLVSVGFVNRGVKTANYHVLRETRCPAVLIEIGFIDNSLDNNIFDCKRNEIIKEIVKAILEQLGINYKENVVNESTTYQKQQAANGQTLYRVMSGSYAQRDNAEKQVKELKSAGFDACIMIFNK